MSSVLVPDSNRTPGEITPEAGFMLWLLVRTSILITESVGLSGFRDGIGHEIEHKNVISYHTGVDITIACMV